MIINQEVYLLNEAERTRDEQVSVMLNALTPEERRGETSIHFFWFPFGAKYTIEPNSPVTYQTQR